jgi:hypothetical protein
MLSQPKKTHSLNLSSSVFATEASWSPSTDGNQWRCGRFRWPRRWDFWKEKHLCLASDHIKVIKHSDKGRKPLSNGIILVAGMVVMLKTQVSDAEMSLWPLWSSSMGQVHCLLLARCCCEGTGECLGVKGVWEKVHRPAGQPGLIKSLALGNHWLKEIADSPQRTQNFLR